MLNGTANASAPLLLSAVLLALIALLGIALSRLAARAPAQTYLPAMGWLRAGIYCSICTLLAAHSGVLWALLQQPLVTPAQWLDPQWRLLTAACVIVVVVGYGVIWPLGTFTDGRARHAPLVLAYGAVWGACQGLLFLCLWTLVGRSGWHPAWVVLGSYLLIGTYNGLWHRYYWDIKVSPPHNYSEWNLRKVLLCHTPNLICCLSHLALYGNAGIFVLLQALALALSAFFMRFPAWWDDYRARPGEERRLSESR